MARLTSVNLGTARDADWVSNGRTAMDKRPVDLPVRVTELGIEGDQVGNPKFHGGVDQAVYAYAREDLEWWAAELGAEIRAGQFAENLTTEGLDLNATRIGTRWRIGSTVLEVVAVRIPCGNFQHWMGQHGFDNAGWVKRFTAAARPGPYLRVVETGTVQAGDAVEVLREPDHDVTVRDVFAALTTQRHRLPEILEADALGAKARAAAEQYVAES